MCLLSQCNSPCEGLGFPPDGLALFYRTARLTPRAAPVSAFFTGADGCPLSQCRLLAPFHDRAADRCLLVATTHLKAKAGAAHDAVRLAEAQQARARRSLTPLLLLACVVSRNPLVWRSCWWSWTPRWLRCRPAPPRCCAAT